MTFNEWLEYGVVNGYCLPPVCATHDGIPMTRKEEEEFDDLDCCLPSVRITDTIEEWTLVYENNQFNYKVGE